MTEVGAQISLNGVEVHPDCWCICLCYLHFAPENPEDGEMYLLVLAHRVVPDRVYRAVKWLCVCVYREAQLAFVNQKSVQYHQGSAMIHVRCGNDDIITNLLQSVMVKGFVKISQH